jgi:serine/threonine protein phosphatase PrpC
VETGNSRRDTAGLYPILHLDTGQFSHAGRRRRNNEDWLGTFQPEDPERLARKGIVFLVADGMGGHQRGEMASRRAVDQVIRAYYDDPSADVAQSLKRAVELANADLHAAAVRDQDGRRWGTTLVAAVVRHDELWIANVGDSRAYLLRRGKLQQLSEDHSLAMAAGGDAPSGDWIGRHVITRALGLKPSVEVDTFPAVKLHAGDRILLCSDGLTTPLSDAEIGDLAARYPPQKASLALVKAANEQGGPDNVSVILISVTELKVALRWQTPRELLSVLVRPETWRLAVEDLVGTSLGGQGCRSPVFVVLMALLIVAVIGMGFILGLVLFSGGAPGP